MTKSRRPDQYMGVLAQTPPNVILAKRAPISSDKAYVPGDIWVNQIGLTAWVNSLGGAWIAIGTGSVGGISTITGGSGGPLSPTAGNINILGTSNQITATGAGSTLTLSLPAAVTVPGSLASTTTMTAGTDITATAGNVIINGAGKQLRVHGGAVTDFIGTATLAAGTVTVANTNIAATDRIFIQRVSINGSTTLGEFTYTISAATSFTITSVILGTPGSPQTGDTSVVTYHIVRQV